jgi:hypothetical protein
MPRHTRSNDEGDALAHAIEAIRIELSGLRDAIDELREEIGWGNRNCKGYNPMLFRFQQANNDSADMQPPELQPCRREQPPIDDRHEAGPRRQVKLW